jgi:hypothetical protein
MRPQIQTTGARASSGRSSAHAYQAGAYLTDGVFLYRVVDLFVTAAGEMAELEDCYGLDVVRVPLQAVTARRLRVVTPAP